MRVNQIACEDCLIFGKNLSDESIDLIFADYPFNCQDGRKDYFSFVSATVELFNRVCKSEANLIVINNPPNSFRSFKFFNEHFFLRQSVSLLRKGAFYPAWHLGYQHNELLMFSHSSNMKLKWNGSRKNHNREFGTDVIEYQNGYRGKGKDWHPQAIPLKLAEFFINISSDKNDLVYVPFVGSGTEIIACQNLGRQFIGTEFNPKYFEMAQRRITQKI